MTFGDRSNASPDDLRCRSNQILRTLQFAIQILKRVAEVVFLLGNQSGWNRIELFQEAGSRVELGNRNDG